MKTFNLHIAAVPVRACAVTVGHGAAQGILSLLERLADVDRVFILHDTALQDIAERVQSLVPDSVLLPVPSGEASKSLETVDALVRELLLQHATRHSLLVNVGGGMISDLGGFLAAVYMRGIRFVNIPTTLLGMADAAIGGKVYVNAGPVKNVIGHEWYPEAVLVDLDILGSLPDAQLREGLVEAVKLGAVLDSEYFGWLEENLERVVAREDGALEAAVENAARIKTEAMGHGIELRHTLNFGHTVGHALEALSQFSLSHGKAVSIGMSCEMALSDFPDRQRVLRALEILDMPVHIPRDIDVRALWDIMRNDKKNVGNEVRIAVPIRIGAAHVQSLGRERFMQLLA
jgi:3-dehydroquinate synthetase